MDHHQQNRTGRVWQAALLAAAWLPGIAGQEALVETRISTTAPNAVFLVDGQALGAPAVFTWPAGSKHTLEIQPWQNAPGDSYTRYVFQHWSTPAGPLADPSNLVTITADPGIPWYNADLIVNYDVALTFYQCSDGGCAPPGTIWVNQVAYQQNADIWLTAGTTVSVEASPNPGYVFAGWAQSGGALNSVFSFVLNAGTMLDPQFAVARAIQLTTVPAGLQVLADRAPVTTPVTLEWGWNTTHTVGAVSPQADQQGRQWLLRSWSDGGDLNHSYQVPPGAAPVTLTAQFVPAVTVQLVTDPPALPLTVDGTSGVGPWSLAWAAGDQHTVSAAEQPTDAQGNPWILRGWSNGGTNPQIVQVTGAQASMGMRLTAVYDALSRIHLDSVPTGLALSVNGAVCRTPCDVQRPIGSEVRLGAPPLIGISDGVRLEFSSWSGTAGAAFTAAAGYRKITANYQTSYRLALATSPAGAGTWRLSPGSADGYYAAGTVVSIGIDPAAGMQFLGWGQDWSGSTNPQSLFMDGPHTVLGRFAVEASPAGPPHAGNVAGATPVQAVAPGSIAALTGAKLADTTAAADQAANPLPQSLGGIALVLAGKAVPLLYVSPQQINFQVPGGLSPGSYQIELQQAGSPPVVAELTVARNAPGLLSVHHQDGSPVTSDSPATRGEEVVVYGTGFGPLVPMPLDGFQVPATPPIPLADPVAILIGERAITPDLAVAEPGMVGVVEVQFRIPADWDSSAPTSVVVQSGGAGSNALALPLR